MSKMGTSSGDDDSMRHDAGTDHVEDLDERSLRSSRTESDRLAAQNQTAAPGPATNAPR